MLVKNNKFSYFVNLADYKTKTMNNFFLLTILLSFALLSCNKRDTDVRYEVNCNGACEVSFSMNSGLVQTESVSGQWSKSYKGRSGTQVFLMVQRTSPNGNFTARILLNGDIYQEVSSNEMFVLESLSGTLP